MKKILWATCIASSLLFIACSSHEDELQQTSQSTLVVSGDVTTTQKTLAATGEEKKLGTLQCTASTNQTVSAVTVKINGLAGFTHPGEQLQNCKLVLQSNGQLVSLETGRSSTTYLNDVVIFTLATPLQLVANTTLGIDVYGTVKSIQNVSYSGEVYVTVQSVMTSNGLANITQPTIGNSLYLLAGYPRVAKTSSGNATELSRIKIYNMSSISRIKINAFQYFATAQIPTDIAKPASTMTPYMDTGSSTGFTIIPNQLQWVQLGSTDYNFSEIGQQQIKETQFRLQAPFVNSAQNPLNGQRIFNLTNIEFNQKFVDGSTQSLVVPQDYKSSVGLSIENTY